jgi:di/tricarboxylate transporter
MLPAGTGPNAIAWATGRIALPRMVLAGALLDVAGVFLIVGAIWAVAGLAILSTLFFLFLMFAVERLAER